MFCELQWFYCFKKKKTPMFLKGVLGYGSVVHLKNTTSSSVHQTQPTKQNKKIPWYCRNSKCYDCFTPVSKLGVLLMAAEQANLPIKLIFTAAGDEKSTLKVTLVPGSTHSDTPITIVQKGFCVLKSENISSPCNIVFHSTERDVFSSKLSKCIHNSILSLWCRNTVKKRNTAI